MTNNVLLFLALVVGLGACGEDRPARTDTTAQDADDPASTEYVVRISGAEQDTLRDGASFGTIMNTKTKERHFVIEMRTPSGFTGGLYFLRGDTLRPEAGTYDLVSAADSVSHDEKRLSLVYRSGARRNLTSTSGTLTIETSSDSLIAGQFEATLRGRVAENVAARSKEEAGQQEVQAQGHFRARRGKVGYMMGF